MHVETHVAIHACIHVNLHMYISFTSYKEVKEAILHWSGKIKLPLDHDSF